MGTLCISRYCNELPKARREAPEAVGFYGDGFCAFSCPLRRTDRRHCDDERWSPSWRPGTKPADRSIPDVFRLAVVAAQMCTRDTVRNHCDYGRAAAPANRDHNRRHMDTPGAQSAGAQ